MTDNANQNKELEEDGEFEIDFDTMECLSKQLEDGFYDLNLLEEDRKNIANPDLLGKAILDEIWKQFGNQIGIDVTAETLIQKYDREHPETYSEIKDDVMNDQRYRDANKKMKEQQELGNLKDEYTGKTLKQNDNANLDHVVSRKEIFEDQRRKQANLDTKDLANKSENLKPTNENLNKSKNDEPINEYLSKRKLREEDLIKQNERANKKVDESNLSDVEKRQKKDKNNKALQNKLDADDKLMKQADKHARKEINKDIFYGATKEVGKKAGKDALKTAIISALFSLLKEIMNGFVRFIKSEVRTFNNLLLETKEAIKSFFSKILDSVKTGASVVLETIVSEIFGPIVSVFKHLASLFKKTYSLFIDVIKYLKDKKNKNKPYSVKVAEVGKIITIGMTIGGAIVLGEVFEKFLLTIPGMQITLPLLGTLANLIGLFLASLVSGLIGAIAINLIDRFIAKRLRAEKTKEIVKKQNDVLNIQQLQKFVAEKKVGASKVTAFNEIQERHKFIKEQLEGAVDVILNKNKISKDTVVVSENSDDFSQMQKDLEDLL